jgi:hypothetical protein
MAGFLFDRLISETADLWFGGRIDAFFSTLEIRFPGNGDAVGASAAIAPKARASGAGGTIRQAGRQGGLLPCHAGSRPSIAALTRSGARKASEIVMLTLRTLQPSRVAMRSAFAPGSA